MSGLVTVSGVSKVKAVLAKIDAFVKAHPYAAIAAAFLIGLVL